MSHGKIKHIISFAVKFSAWNLLIYQGVLVKSLSSKRISDSKRGHFPEVSTTPGLSLKMFNYEKYKLLKIIILKNHLFVQFFLLKEFQYYHFLFSFV